MPPPMKTSARPRPAPPARLPRLTILSLAACLSAALLTTASPAHVAAATPMAHTATAASTGASAAGHASGPQAAPVTNGSATVRIMADGKAQPSAPSPARAPAGHAPAADPAQTARCTNPDLNLVVLGSGGPELNDRRASTGYLLREGEQARVLIDFGSGSSLRFEQARAQIADLRGVLISHLHVDHINDLPALVKASFFSNRTHDLPILGPSGNDTIPDTPTYVQRLFGTQGAYAYLSDFLDGEARFALRPQAVDARVDASRRPAATRFDGRLDDFHISAIGVSHGLLPALAWRIEKDGCSVVISGDTSNHGRTLDVLAGNADLFVAHNAVPQDSTDAIALRLHMPPAEIGRIAGQNGVRHLLLAHLMQRTRLVQKATAAAIAPHYRGPVQFARDGDIYQVQDGRKVGNLETQSPVSTGR